MIYQNIRQLVLGIFDVVFLMLSPSKHKTVSAGGEGNGNDIIRWPLRSQSEHSKPTTVKDSECHIYQVKLILSQFV